MFQKLQRKRVENICATKSTLYQDKCYKIIYEWTTVTIYSTVDVFKRSFYDSTVEKYTTLCTAFTSNFNLYITVNSLYQQTVYLYLKYKIYDIT